MGKAGPSTVMTSEAWVEPGIATKYDPEPTPEKEPKRVEHKTPTTDLARMTDVVVRR